MTLRAVFFDIDGTLVDSNEQHVNAWAFAFRDEGRPQELDDIRAQIGKGGDLLVPTLLPNATVEMVERLSSRHGDYFKTMYLDQVRAFPDAATLLRRVHASGRKVLLASSAKADELDHYVDLLGLRDVLDDSTSIDDVETSKPAPDIFGAALDKAGVEPHEAVVIGDTPYDITAAAKAGIAAIGLTSGPFKEAEMREAGAMAVYSDAADLLAQYDNSVLGGEAASSWVSRSAGKSRSTRA